MKSETPSFYIIRLEGILDETWAEWFDGMTLSWSDELPGETQLSGYVVDQPALHGVLEKIRDLNLCLICVERANGAPIQERYSNRNNQEV